MRSFRMIIAVALAIALGACGSSSTAGSSSSGLTAAQLCALVTQAEMSAALGAQVGVGVPSGVNAPSCTWQSADSRAGATIARIEPSDVGKIPFGLQGLSDPKAIPISDLGDAAFFATSDDLPNSELDFKKGSNAIDITAAVATAHTQAQQQAEEKAIALAAVKRL